MIQPGQAHGNVERAAANVGLYPAGTLDDVNKGLANNSQHGTTLPEDVGLNQRSGEQALDQFAALLVGHGLRVDEVEVVPRNP